MSAERLHDHATIPSLDGIRAVSVFIVLVSHAGLGHIVPGGLGVTVFFFLSGYLITTLLMSEYARAATIDIKAFYLRRAFRLLPPLLITLAIAYGLAFAGLLGGETTIEGLLAQLFYLANYYGIYFGGGVPHGTGIYWSLAVEEHFYMLYPVAFWLLLGRSFRFTTIGGIFIVGCLIILAWRIHLVQQPDISPNRTYIATDTRIDSILYGCVLAVLKNPIHAMARTDKLSRVHWSILLISICALLFATVYRDAFFRETFRYSIQGAALIPIFYFAVAFAHAWPFRYLNARWMVTLGVYSYAIYLIHYIVSKGLNENAPWLTAHVAAPIVIVSTISIAYAAFIDRYVDSFFRSIRHRFRPSVRPASSG